MPNNRVLSLIPRIKICCIGSVEESRDAVRYGAAAVGLVSHMPSGPGIIEESLIADIANQVPPAIASFLLTSKQSAQAIIAQHNRCQTSTIQLCDRVTIECVQQIRQALPSVKLVQVIHINGPKSIDEALEFDSVVDGLLLDSGNQTLTVKELGGTGRTHDWELSRRIREAVSSPVFLAGGLHAGNVTEAIRTVRPFGVDVCSGVRTNSQLDVEKLQDFVAAVAMETTQDGTLGE